MPGDAGPRAGDAIVTRRHNDPFSRPPPSVNLDRRYFDIGTGAYVPWIPRGTETPRHRLAALASEAGVSLDDVLSRKRAAPLVAVRRRFASDLKALGLSVAAIAAWMDRDVGDVYYYLGDDWRRRMVRNRRLGPPAASAGRSQALTRLASLFEIPTFLPPGALSSPPNWPASALPSDPAAEATAAAAVSPAVRRTDSAAACGECSPA